MKEFDPLPEQIAQEIVAPVKTEKKKMASKPLKKGNIYWEVDLATHVATPVIYKTSTLGVDANGHNQVRHSIEYRKDKYYCMALNLDNAMRKYRRWFIANQNAKAIMALMKPIPESPSEVVSQSE